MTGVTEGGRPAKLFGSWFGGVTATDDPFRASFMLRSVATIAGVFLFVFFAWAIFSKLDSAVNASGHLSVESKRKKIQHQQGGIIDVVFVRNGDAVKAGQKLVSLSPIQSMATLNMVMSERDAVMALTARLLAELDEKASIEFPVTLTKRRGIESADSSVRGQERLFYQRKETYESMARVLEKRQRQHQEVIKGLRSQLTSAKTQMSLIAKERSGIESLYSAGYATLPRLLALERAEANLLGQKGGLEAAIAENILKKEETEIEILRLRSERLDTIASEMRESQRKEFELAERVRAAQDVVDRSIIVAPSSGKIVALSVFSSGEVIQPGAILMEVVPQNDQLIIEAHIDPNDADNLRPGMEARVRLNPFKTQGSPIVSGQVRGVSADRLMDEHNGQSYYLVEVELDRNEVRAALGGSSNLQPGLPAEVMISLGEHSPLEYLLAPLSRRVRHAMSEE